MGLFTLLGVGKKSKNIQEFVVKGALIIDVRTVGEFNSDHITGAKNIPLALISTQIEVLKKANKPLLICCQSGMRSAQATAIFKKNGLEILNGGGWGSLDRKLKNE